MIELSNRQLSMLKRLTGKPSSTIRELSQQMNLSRETIRKELLPLEDAGLLDRSHGKIHYRDIPENADILESSGVLSKTQRKKLIVNLLKLNGEMRTSTLTQRLRVSAVTVRNDLLEMENDGVILRKHGGATLFNHSLTAHLGDNNGDFSPKVRILGQHSLMHINPGETIFLDSGEVGRFVAYSLPPYSNNPIVTNSMSILETLRDRQYGYPITISGPQYSHNSNRFFMGNHNQLEDQKIDKAFICCRSYANYIYFLDEKEDIETVEEICETANKIYMIIDSKFLDVQGSKPFSHKKYSNKLQEVVVDDGIGSFRASILFSHNDPLVICGHDFTYRKVSKQQHKIGFLVNKDRNYFVQAVHNSLLEASAACNSISLIIRECDGDYDSTVKNFNLLLEEQVNLVIDYSLCMESLMYVGDRCLSRGIKLVSVDYMAPGATYFGADNAKAGQIAGKKAVAFIKEHGKGVLDHLIVLGRYGHSPITKLRISSALEFIENELNFKQQSAHMIEWGNPDTNPTQELIHMLKEIPDDHTLLIMAFNLRHLLASYDLITQYRNSENTIIVGHNYTKQIDELMKKGKSPIIGCVHYNPEMYGEKIMDIVLRLLEHVEVPSRNYTNLTWIEKDWQ